MAAPPGRWHGFADIPVTFPTFYVGQLIPRPTLIIRTSPGYQVHTFGLTRHRCVCLALQLITCQRLIAATTSLVVINEQLVGRRETSKLLPNQLGQISCRYNRKNLWITNVSPAPTFHFFCYCVARESAIRRILINVSFLRKFTVLILC